MSPRPGNPGRIHVVQVIGTMHIGGAENAVVHIAQGLDRSRFDVTLCCTRERGVLAERLAASGVDVRLAAPPTRRQRYFTPYYLARELKRLGADVQQARRAVGVDDVGTQALQLARQVVRREVALAAGRRRGQPHIDARGRQALRQHAALAGAADRNVEA